MGKLLLSLILVILLIVGTVTGQIPQTISYQGILTDNNGVLVTDGDYAMEFNLYNVSTAGSPLWTETQTVTITNGIFNVKLGAVNPLNLTFDEGYWLGITIDSGSELSPRIELTASAYSLNSQSVEDSSITASSISNGQIVRSINSLKDDVIISAGNNIAVSQNGDSLIISTTGIGNGDITAVNAGTGLTGGGSSGDVSLNLDTVYTDNRYVEEGQVNAVTNAMIQDNIISSIDGVSNDAGNVDFVAGANMTITPDNASNQITFSASVSGDGNTLDQAYDQGGPGAGRIIQANNGAVHVSGGDGLTVSGNVGIGTTTPTFPLTLLPSTNTRGLHIDHNQTGSGMTRAMYVDLDKTYVGSSSIYGGEFQVTNNNGSGSTYGLSATVNGTSTGLKQGIRGVAVGPGTAHGVYGLASGSDTQIGIYGSAIGTGTNWAGYFGLGNVHISNRLGIGTETPSAGLHVSGVDGALFTGTYNSGTIPIEGSGIRMMWYPGKVAFRVGAVAGTQWDDSNIGSNSFAIGTNVIASSGHATAMGNWTTASGPVSTTMGYYTTASGNTSTAMGSYISTSGTGSFAIGDNSTTTTLSGTTNNRFYARFANGYNLFTNSAATVGAYLGSGANSWGSISDSTKKENIKKVNGEEVLIKIREFNLSSWNYKGQDAAKFRHYGPMAQDFYAAFGNDGIGTIGNDTTLSSADFDGINFIAIQALEKRTSELKEKTAEIEKLRNGLQSIKSENSKLYIDLTSVKQENLEMKKEINDMASLVNELKAQFVVLNDKIEKNKNQLQLSSGF